MAPDRHRIHIGYAQSTEAASAARLRAERPDMHTIGHQLIAISPDTYRQG
jgi:hypothetical protein